MLNKMDYKYLFFVMPYKTPKDSNYEHGSIALAEGMKELGITFYGNIDYWQEYGSQQSLINKQPPGYDANVHIYSDAFILEHFEELENMVDKSKINILIDPSGFPWLETFGQGFRGEELIRIYNNEKLLLFDLILRAHSVSALPYQPNVRPWAFGLTNRIIKEAAKSADLVPQRSILSNFRISLDIRKLALQSLNPLLGKKFTVIDELTESLAVETSNQITFESDEERYYWERSGRRHRQNYFRMLNQAQLTYTFGGLIDINNIHNRQFSKFLRWKNRLMKNIFQRFGLDFSSYIYLYQFDSWRIWEALVSNSCPINMDFEDWGLLLPELPVNGKHYIGIKKLEFDQAAEKILALTDDEIKQIGQQGKQWVLENYAPVPTAQRFEKLVKSL